MNSKYFKESEQVCKCCNQGAEKINPTLLDRLDRLRELWGYPIYVSCMYRCPSHNAEVGGVYNSQHVLGNGADIYIDGDYQTFYDYVLNSNLFDSVGYYPNDEFVHVDVRDNGKHPNYYRW